MKKTCKRLAMLCMAVMLVASLFAISTPSASAFDVNGEPWMVSTTAGLNVRKGAGTNYAKAGTLSYGSVVYITEYRNGWGKISYVDGASTYYGCWISTSYMHYFGGGCILYGTIKTPNNANVYLRIGPSTSYASRTKIPSGTRVEVWFNYNGWYYVRYNGTFGWVTGQYLR